MNLYDFIIQNKEILKILYGLIIGFICLIIVLKTDKLFRISFHQGIRYFRNAFFFYGLGFITRYVFGTPLLADYFNQYYFLIIKILLEFFLIMAGFFLFYSLVWKKFEAHRKGYFSSLLNPPIFIFYILTFLIIFLDNLWKSYFFMFSSQIIIFILAFAISLINHVRDEGKHRFLKFYFLAMILSFIVWVLNSLAAFFINWDQIILINVSGINIILFLLFLFGVIYITNIK